MLFCTFLYRLCTATTGKCLIASFMEDVNKRQRISFSLSLNLSAVLKQSTPGKFAYTCHFQQTEINATKIEKKGEFFLKPTFSLPLSSSMLKLPNNEPEAEEADGDVNETYDEIDDYWGGGG